MQCPKIHRAESPTHGLTEIGTTFNGTGNICERLGGSGGMLPKKFSNMKALKRHFLHSQADSCVKKVRELIIIFFLTLTKRALSSAEISFHN